MPVYSSDELKRMRKAGLSQTDWARVRAMTDDEIICDEDAPELSDAEFKQAVLWLDDGKRVSFTLDPDVRAWLAPPSDRIFRLNDMLRMVMQKEATAGAQTTDQPDRPKA